MCMVFNLQMPNHVLFWIHEVLVFLLQMFVTVDAFFLVIMESIDCWLFSSWKPGLFFLDCAYNLQQITF